MGSTVWQAIVVYIWWWMVVLLYAGRQGTVLFMKSKNNVSMSDLYEEIIYTDYNSTTKHFWNITDLMDGPSKFRSPLLDRQVELDMTEFEIFIYNAAGEVLTSVPYSMVNINPMSDSGILSTHGPASVLLHSFDDDDAVRLLTINVQSTEPTGTQFILSTDEDFHALPERISLGCYNFTSGSLFAYITETTETVSGETCVEQCITEINSTFALAFTTINQTTIVHRCACVTDIGSSTYATNQTVTKCPDDTDCGCTIHHYGDSTVIASLYNMSQTNTFLNNLNTRTSTSQMVKVFTNSPYIGLSQRTFIVKVNCQQCPKNLTYRLGFSQDNTCDSTSNFHFYGEGLGNAMTFNTSDVMTIFPTPATCLNFDFLSNIDTNYIFELKTLTDIFIKGNFLQIVGHWNNPECTPEPVLQNTTIIPDSQVTVVQMISPSTFIGPGDDFHFPEMSAGVISIVMQSNTTVIHIIKRIVVSVDVDAKITYVVKGFNECVAIGMGHRYNQSYNSVVKSNLTQNTQFLLPLPDVCVYNITLIVNSTNPTGNVSQRINTMSFELYGCIIYDWNNQALCVENEIADYVMVAANVSWYWIPHPVRAVTYLRPGGPGLVMYRYADPYIIIELNERWVPIEVTRVLITGDVILARISIGNTTNTITNGTYRTLDYKPNDVRGHKVLIDQIIFRMDIPAADPIFDFPLIHVDVEVCLLNLQSGAISSTTTPTPTATPLTTSPTSSATPYSTSTIATQSLSNSSTTAAAITKAIPTLGQQPSTNVTTSTVPATSFLTTSNSNNASTTLAHLNSITSTHTYSSTMAQQSTFETTTTASSGSINSTTANSSSTTSSPSTTTSSPSMTASSPSTTPASQSTTTSSPSTKTASPSSTTFTLLSQLPPATTISTLTTSGHMVTPELNACCLCLSNTVNLTKSEVDILVEQLVRNLTVSKRKTSAYKRSLVSAPDERVSARMVGTIGVAMMALTGGLILAMDFTHIVGVLKCVKHVIVGLFIR